MKLRNKSETKIITLGGVSILPGETGELPCEFEQNPLLKILPVEVINDPGTGEDIATLIASLKNAKEPRVRELCEQYGVEIPEGVKLPDLKRLLIEKLTEAGDDDGGTGENS